MWETIKDVIECLAWFAIAGHMYLTDKRLSKLEKMKEG